MKSQLKVKLLRFVTPIDHLLMKYFKLNKKETIRGINFIK